MTSKPKLPRFRAALRLLVLTLFLGALLIGCAMSGRATKTAPVAPDICSPWRPIYLTKAEAKMLSDESARQILAHNQTGERLCNWQRKGESVPQKAK